MCFSAEESGQTKSGEVESYRGKPKKQKPVTQLNKEVSKKASVVQKQSRVAAATLTAQNLITCMMHGNVSPDSVYQIT